MRSAAERAGEHTYTNTRANRTTWARAEKRTLTRAAKPAKQSTRDATPSQRLRVDDATRTRKRIQTNASPEKGHMNHEPEPARLHITPAATIAASADIVDRLRRRFGLGSKPAARMQLYQTIAAAIAKHGERAETLVREAASQASAASTHPDRYFCAAIKRKFSEAGITAFHRDLAIYPRGTTDQPGPRPAAG